MNVDISTIDRWMKRVCTFALWWFAFWTLFALWATIYAALHHVWWAVIVQLILACAHWGGANVSARQRAHFR